jgi:uncharacterized metal-binding protein YceD (DUF177 family)
VSAAPEFSRPQRLDTIGAGELKVHVAADAPEMAALATRFGLVSVERLEAGYVLQRDAAGVIATGHVSAVATQACVATGDPVAARIEEDFALRFVADGDEVPEEIELDEDALDTMVFEGGAIDLGEAAAETFALALDPFPRSPVAAEALKAAGVKGEDEVKPLGALAGLKDLLGKG